LIALKQGKIAVPSLEIWNLSRTYLNLAYYVAAVVMHLLKRILSQSSRVRLQIQLQIL